MRVPLLAMLPLIVHRPLPCCAAGRGPQAARPSLRPRAARPCASPKERLRRPARSHAWPPSPPFLPRRSPSNTCGWRRPSPRRQSRRVRPRPGPGTPRQRARSDPGHAPRTRRAASRCAGRARGAASRPQEQSGLPERHRCALSGASMPCRRTRVPRTSSVSPSMTRVELYKALAANRNPSFSTLMRITLSALLGFEILARQQDGCTKHQGPADAVDETEGMPSNAYRSPLGKPAPSQ